MSCACPAHITPCCFLRSCEPSPLPVSWIDPAPAIARRVVQLLGPGARTEPHGVLAAFTAGTCLTGPLRDSLAQRGVNEVAVEAMPLPMQ